MQNSLPTQYRQEETFNDQLSNWLKKTPWLSLSVAAHVLVFLFIQAIPWNLFEKEPELILEAKVQVTTPEEFLNDPEPEPEIIEPDEVEEVADIQDINVDTPDISSEDTDIQSEGDPNDSFNSPFDSSDFNNVLGIGGGAGSKFGGRFKGKGKKTGGGGGTQEAVANGLKWLSTHQSPDGYWDADDFAHNNDDDTLCNCEGPGNANQDVGITGLCLLAYLGDGNTTRDGKYVEEVKKAVQWLIAQQNYDTGLIGEDIGHQFVYDHSIATLALAEAYYFSKSPNLKNKVKRAARYIEKARNPYGAWRYDVPPLGENDTSISGWMVFALKAVEESGIKVDQDAYEGALGWIDEVTDPGNGRIGYEQAGSSSSRVSGLNDHFSPDKGEAMTAVGLLCRFFLGQTPDDTPEMEQHADLMLKTLPEWDPDGFGCDMYYWYYGSYAMYQMGGKHWDKWNKAMKPAIVGSQRQDGHFDGSWDPAGPWGFKGGRVYSTALMVLSLEVYYRYSRVLGAR